MIVVEDYFRVKLPKPYRTPDQPVRGELREMIMRRDVEKMAITFKKYPKAVNQVSSFLLTPLHDACRLGDREMVQMLLMKGANVHAK
jgi:hypothetical protein